MNQTLAVDERIEVARNYVRVVFNGHRPDLAREYCVDDVVWHGNSLGEVSGIDNLTALLTAFLGALPDLVAEEQDVIASNDLVVVRLIVTATHKGDLLGIPATGRRVQWNAVDIYRITDDGKISEEWAADDMAAFASQLGAILLPWASQGNEMSANPIEVVGEWLQNLLDPDVANRLVAPDATYVSLNTDDPELQQIMPWTGTAYGPQAFLNNLGTMFTRWENQAFNVNAMFASGENVAVFGDFRYRSHSLGKVVSSPFSIFIKVVDGQVTYLQFLEDSYATASSFRKGGSWTIQTEPDAEPIEV